jgi:hypothetical protein
MDNPIYIPFLNPVRFYDTARAVTSTYRTKHFDDFMFSERIYYWEQKEDYKRLWQTTDIIKLQFESTFDPIIVSLHDQYGVPKITLPALVGLPNKFYSNTFSYEIAMSLAGLLTGCYFLRLTLGTSGPDQLIYESPWQYISATPLEGTALFEYWHNRFHEDVMFETGIKFQMRLPCNFGRLKAGRTAETYKDQRKKPHLLNSKTFRQFPLAMGDEFGLPDDEIDLLNMVWGCNNVTIDRKFFVAAANEFEYIETKYQPKRGVSLLIEDGLNRSSKVIIKNVDTTKKLFYAITVEAKVFGDTSNQGSANTVPIITVE